MNCYLIQFYKSLTLLNALFYENFRANYLVRA